MMMTMMMMMEGTFLDDDDDDDDDGRNIPWFLIYGFQGEEFLNHYFNLGFSHYEIISGSGSWNLLQVTK